MEQPKNKVSLSTMTKFNIFLMYMFNLFCEYYYGFARKTYTWQCKLYVYLANRSRKRDSSFFDLTSRTNDGLELNIHKALLGKNLSQMTELHDIYDESMRIAIFKEAFARQNDVRQNDVNQNDNYSMDTNDLAEDITYYLRFFAAYYPHSCEELKQFLEDLQFDTSKPLNLTFRLENSARTYYLVIDLKNAKNLLNGVKFAFGEIDFAHETRHELM